MAKRTDALDLSLHYRDAAAPAYHWLYSAIREEILEGRLRPGLRLPATRDLARQYGLSRGTIVNAFDQLKSEGYVEGSPGSGTFVSQVLPEDLLHVKPVPRGKVLARIKGRHTVSDYASRLTLVTGLEHRPSRAFRANVPALDLFPTDLWAQVTARRLRGVSMNLLLGCGPLGYQPLRQAVADYLNASRGVRCSVEQVVIVSGVLEALDLVGRLVLNPGHYVGVEEPGYLAAGGVFEALGAKLRPLRVDDEGLVINDATLRDCRLVYITPAHQFPLGIIMSLPRRLALLEAARTCGALIFEDDYDSEFRYCGRPVPALQGLDKDGLVMFCGSFSKVMFPSLRLGYLVLPEGLVDHFAAARSITARHPPVLEQAVLCDFMTEGHFGRHIRRMREVYAERHSVLIESARKSLSGLLEISRIEAGLQTSAWLEKGIDEDEIATAAGERDVEVIPLGSCCRLPSHRAGLQLGFAAIDTREIRRGVRELAVVLETTLRKQSHRI